MSAFSDAALIKENYVPLRRGGLFYLSSGPDDGPLIIFLHGWPELAISWRHQLSTFGRLGFRAIAIDMPGFGRSMQFDRFEDYALENLVGDLVEFIGTLGRERAIWIGHDMGSPVAWSVASHHPEICDGVGNLCVPYRTVEKGVDALIALIDRNIYSEEEHPAGHWDYMLHYEEDFDGAVSFFDRNTRSFLKAMFSRADPSLAGQPLITAGVRARGGWFADESILEEATMDEAVIDPQSLSKYVATFTRTGFRGPCSHYMNHALNANYTDRAVNGGRLDMPVLFIRAEYDHWCECIDNPFAEEMRQLCADLTSVSIATSHWAAQEHPLEVNAALTHWLATKTTSWPKLEAVPWKEKDVR